MTDHIAALQKLANLITQFECNVKMTVLAKDIAHLEPVDTPRASRIMHMSTGYVIWKWTAAGHLPGDTGVSIERAAKLVIDEYMTAKAVRIKQYRPDLPLEQIIKTLMEGYQHKQPVIRVRSSE